MDDVQNDHRTDSVGIRRILSTICHRGWNVDPPWAPEQKRSRTSGWKPTKQFRAEESKVGWKGHVSIFWGRKRNANNLLPYKILKELPGEEGMNIITRWPVPEYSELARRGFGMKKNKPCSTRTCTQGCVDFGKTAGFGLRFNRPSDFHLRPNVKKFFYRKRFSSEVVEESADKFSRFFSVTARKEYSSWRNDGSPRSVEEDYVEKLKLFFKWKLLSLIVRLSQHLTLP